jgi:putative membrane protein
VRAKTLLPVLAALALFPTFSAQAAEPSVSTADRSFVFGASTSNLAEIAAAKVALTKGNSSTKAFANKMLANHTTMEQALNTVAAKLQIDLQTSPTSAQHAALTRISKLSGSAFDKAYRANQITAHKATIAIFQKEIKSGGASPLKAAATKNLPVIKMHLQMAQKLATGGM